MSFVWYFYTCCFLYYSYGTDKIEQVGFFFSKLAPINATEMMGIPASVTWQRCLSRQLSQWTFLLAAFAVFRVCDREKRSQRFHSMKYIPCLTCCSRDVDDALDKAEYLDDVDATDSGTVRKADLAPLHIYIYIYPGIYTYGRL